MEKIIKKILAALLVIVIISALASGLTWLIFDQWKIGLYYSLMFYGIIGLMALVGSVKMLLDYVFND